MNLIQVERGRIVLLLLIVGVYFHSANAFYLPGLAPKAFCSKEKSSDTCKVPIYACNHMIHFLDFKIILICYIIRLN